ncbi:MAG TPA: phosphatase PAP2-related protein [Flavobacteriales bacterium]|nr:phosphatase PAP2-related protein [Flavobacteriales bacterium]
MAAAVAVPMLVVLPRFFASIQARPGSFPWEPLLPHFGPADTSVLTFSILYGSMLFTLVRAGRSPILVLRGLHAYLIMMLFRMACIRLYTLEPPPDIVPLIDPLTQHFYPGEAPFLKDLFFSGHTATMALLYAISIGRPARVFTLLGTVTIGALVLLQHAHWTIDVLVAPVAVLLAWRLSAYSLKACGVEAA